MNAIITLATHSSSSTAQPMSVLETNDYTHGAVRSTRERATAEEEKKEDVGLSLQCNSERGSRTRRARRRRRRQRWREEGAPSWDETWTYERNRAERKFPNVLCFAVWGCRPSSDHLWERVAVEPPSPRLPFPPPIPVSSTRKGTSWPCPARPGPVRFFAL